MTLAYFVLFAWPLVVVIFFKTYPSQRALIYSILFAFLLLPPKLGVDLPLIPTLDKASLPAIIALLSYLLFRSEQHPADMPFIPRSHLARGSLAILTIALFGTVMTNGDALQFGPRFIPSLGIYDAFSMMADLIFLLIPFFMAHKLLGNPDSHLLLLKVLMISALVYSLPALFEVRMSPQLNRWIYGYHPSNFVQQIRYGGFRPTVFIGHGLAVAMFFTVAILATLSIFRTTPEKSKTILLMTATWLAITLVLSKSVGATMSAIIFAPVILFLRPRQQIAICAIAMTTIMLYPMLRGQGIIPVEWILEKVQSLDANRAQSLGVRLTNEEILIDRAREKPLFGWGGWGRGRVYTSLGKDITVTDGAWVSMITDGGWFRYITQFGLLCLPPILLWARRPALEIDQATAGITVILTVYMLDAIPNTGITPITWLICGALWGRLSLGNDASGVIEKAKDAPQSTSRYRREFTELNVFQSSKQNPHDKTSSKTAGLKSDPRRLR